MATFFLSAAAGNNVLRQISLNIAPEFGIIILTLEQAADGGLRGGKNSSNPNSTMTGQRREPY
jgi:hypothetical protein